MRTNCNFSFVAKNKKAAALRVRAELNARPLIREVVLQAIDEIDAEPNSAIEIHAQVHQFTPAFAGEFVLSLSVKPIQITGN